MYDLYLSLRESKTCLSYLGGFSDRLTIMLIDLTENYIANKSQLDKLKRKVSFLIAESFQNVVRHGIPEEDASSEIAQYKDFFQISIQEDRVIVSSANAIKQKEVKALDERINHLNSLDSDQLKELYKEVLSTGTISAKGGASLGLIEMVRKSGLPLKKHFEPVTDEYSLVFMSMEITGNQVDNSRKINMADIVSQYKSFIEKDVCLLYKGDFSTDSNAYLINMLQNNLVDERNISSEGIKNIITIIEVLQNVSKHGKSIEGFPKGIFAISKENGKLVINSGNFVDVIHYNNLKNRLEKIKSSSLEEIEAIYKNNLANTRSINPESSGLGLLEIARFTRNDFDYELMEAPEHDFFYSIKINTE